MKLSIPPIVSLVHNQNQYPISTSTLRHATIGGGAFRGIHKNNVIILLYGNISKYIATSEIVNSFYCPTCISLKSMFHPDRHHWTCCHQCKGVRGMYKKNQIILLYGNIAKYIALSEILNSCHCPTDIPLK